MPAAPKAEQFLKTQLPPKQGWANPLQPGSRHRSLPDVEGYCAWTPVLTACPLSVFTVVEQLENATRMRIAPNVDKRIVRIVLCL